jgi:hypothetical protein
MAIDYDDFRADIGDANSAFTDAEIDTLEQRAIARWSEDVAYEGARVLAINQLLASAAKLADYAANESSEKKSQVFKHLSELRKLYKSDLDDARDDVAGASVRSGRSTRKLSRRKEYPDNA